MHIIQYEKSKPIPKVSIEMNSPIRTEYKFRLFAPDGNDGKPIIEREGHNSSNDKQTFSLEQNGSKLHGATARWRFTLFPSVAGESYNVVIRFSQGNKVIKSIPAYIGNSSENKPVVVHDDAVFMMPVE